MPGTPAGSVRPRAASRSQLQIDELTLALIDALRAQPNAHENPRLARLLGVLGAELALRTARPENRYSAAKSMALLETIKAHPDMGGRLANLADKVCVEVGCGGLNPGGGLFAMLLAGARQGIGIDLDDIESPALAVHALYSVLCAALTRTARPRIPGSLRDILDRIRTFDIDKLAVGDSAGVDQERLQFVQRPLGDSGIPDASVDVMQSNSLLEHVPDPEAMIADMARLMKPGGLAVHAIDGTDHRWYVDRSVHRLAFLREDVDDAIVHDCNRIAPMNFGALFERHGFEVRGVFEGAHIDLTEADVAEFAPRFRDVSKDRRDVLRARFYLQRR